MRKQQTIIALIGLIFLIAAFGVHRIAAKKDLENEALTLQNKARVLGSIAETDKIRLNNIRKAVSVIDRFNPSLPVELKYEIATEISNAGMKYKNLDVDLICATITHESAFSWNPGVVSKKGAMGLMQVMPTTGRFLASIEGVPWTSPEEVLFDPVINIRLGTRYLSSLIELYEVDGGLAAYNGGLRRAALWLAQNRAEGILYKETQNYVPAVLSLYEEFREYN